MLTEGVRPPIPEQRKKERAIAYFYENGFDKQIHAFWMRHSPNAILLPSFVASNFTQDQLIHWKDTVDNDPAFRQVHDQFNTLTGITFEFLALAFLQTSKRNGDISYEPLVDDHFDTIAANFQSTGKVEVSPRSGDPYFNATSMQWEGHFIGIPDGFVTYRKGHRERVVTGVYECKLSRKSGGIDGEWLFVEFLREHPHVAEEVLRTIFSENTIEILEDPDFQFLFVTRRNIEYEAWAKARRNGWDTVISPFVYYDISKQTALLLRAMS